MALLRVLALFSSHLGLFSLLGNVSISKNVVMVREMV